MKNILTIEIKDNKTILSLTKLINGESNLMYHKSYPNTNNIRNYDSDICSSIKNELVNADLFNTIDESYLTINTKKAIVQTFQKELKYNTDIKSEKNNIINELKLKYSSLKVLDLIFSDTSVNFTKKIINITAELIEKNYFYDILKKFKFVDINFNKIIPTTKAIESSSNLHLDKEKTIFSVLVEEKFTQLAIVNDGTISFSTKWNSGLNNIYEHIASSMTIDKFSAKKLFKSFGTIPPEDVIDDKVVHSVKHGKEIEIFTKKDVSKYITEMVNNIFSNIKTEVDLRKNGKKVKIIFNGEIQSLDGFKKYAKKSFAEKNIERFGSEIIGLSKETEFITTGMLQNIEKQNIKKIDASYDRPKISVLNKFARMYNYI